MALSRKHYEAIAAALKDARDFNDPIPYLVGRFIVQFEDDNPNFDAERFVKATGLCD